MFSRKPKPVPHLTRLHDLRERAGATRIGVEVADGVIEIVAFYEDGPTGGPVVSLAQVKHGDFKRWSEYQMGTPLPPRIGWALDKAEKHLDEMEERAMVTATRSQIHIHDHEPDEEKSDG